MRIKKAAALILGLIIIMCASSCGGNDGKTNLTVKTEQETSQAPAAASPVQTQNEEAIPDRRRCRNMTARSTLT